MKYLGIKNMCKICNLKPIKYSRKSNKNKCRYTLFMGLLLKISVLSKLIYRVNPKPIRVPAGLGGGGNWQADSKIHTQLQGSQRAETTLPPPFSLWGGGRGFLYRWLLHAHPSQPFWCEANQNILYFLLDIPDRNPVLALNIPAKAVHSPAFPLGRNPSH